ncbi:MAG TPA: response regulator transcription factor [Catalimonadaceae bacterium]|nr:response regulator transcription factor [Catalimonadaceae bacterium]
MTTIRIALVDDHALFRKGIVKLTEEDPHLEVRVEAATGQELLEKISQQKGDMVFTDISMPDMDGMEVTRWIARDHKTGDVTGQSLLFKHFDGFLANKHHFCTPLSNDQTPFHFQLSADRFA